MEFSQVLHRWLADRAWRRSFTTKDTARGLSYAHSSRISRLTLQPGQEDPHSGRQNLIISAAVQGTRPRPYQVELDIFPMHASQPGVLHCSAECSCPVQIQCKHGAAVLEYLSRNPHRIELPDSPSGTRPGVPDDFRRWLQRLEAGIQTPPAAKPPRDFLAYCIEPAPEFASTPTPVLELRKAREGPQTGLRVTDTRARARADSPAAYLRPADLPLVALYQSLQTDPYESPPLRGGGWLSLIAGALREERLFWQRGDHSYVRLAAGPKLRAEPVWRETADHGQATPALRFPDDRDRLLLPLDPPHYLDAETASIGLLESSLPAAALEEWLEGPSIASADFGACEELLAPLATRGLPTPEGRTIETLPPVAPRPALEILENPIDAGFSSLETLVGKLSFTYHDSPPLAPANGHAAPNGSWVRGDTRYVVPRDLKAEKDLQRRLAETGLDPLDLRLSAHRIDPSQGQLLQLQEILFSIEESWLAWLDTHAEALREEGWTVEVDPDTGLVVHEVTDFHPAIEAESAHGIDWFRFDLSGEVDGESISLLPFIAEALSHGLPDLDRSDLPDSLVFQDESSARFIRFPTQRFLEICHSVAHLFQGGAEDEPRLDRVTAAGLAHSLDLDGSATARALADFGRKLATIEGLPDRQPPAALRAELRPYQLDGYRWLRFLAENGLHGILADDMGLGKTVQTLAFLAGHKPKKDAHKPSLVIAPTSVITNWAAEAERFTPRLRTLLLHGPARKSRFAEIPEADVIFTSYPLLARDHETLTAQPWHTVVLDEAQAIKNPKTAVAGHACALRADHRVCLSGTPMENHLGELWSLMRFLMPGYLGDSDTFRETFRNPIERERSPQAQLALNRRVAPLILRRTKEEVAADLPAKSEVIHHLDLSAQESDLYESVRATMDKRVREAIAAKGLGRSHIIVLDALLKLRQVCCHAGLLNIPEAARITQTTKLTFLTRDLLPSLIEEGRRILIFSQFTSMLALLEAHCEKRRIPFLKLTGQTRDRRTLVEQFQRGETPVFLISLKAGGTGLNLTAADTVIHYDPWWNPAAENQATDRAHRIGQDKPVFVHKLICRGTIEDRILELQARKSGLVEALLSNETTRLRLDRDTLSHLLSPLGTGPTQPQLRPAKLRPTRPPGPAGKTSARKREIRCILPPCTPSLLAPWASPSACPPWPRLRCSTSAPRRSKNSNGKSSTTASWAACRKAATR